MDPPGHCYRIELFSKTVIDFNMGFPKLSFDTILGREMPVRGDDQVATHTKSAIVHCLFLSTVRYDLLRKNPKNVVIIALVIRNGTSKSILYLLRHPMCR